MKYLSPSVLWPIATLMTLAIAAVLFRPLMPIDETRYMTVAWEMRLHHGWFAPLTLNFELYSHKPPMLFWLINIFWSVFGVTRAAGIVPVTLASLGVVLLTVRLGQKILPPKCFDPLRITLLMLGSIPFIIYSTLMMFDVTLALFVLASLIALVTYAEKRQFRYILLMALFTGLGLLTKGPVAYLYIICPFLLAPLWVKNFDRPLSWYAHLALWLVLSLMPVSLWLLPVLHQSDNHFAFWLLWEQTAGRVAGNFKDAHIRPFYFYVPFLPLMAAPWLLFPAFWTSLKTVDTKSAPVRFLLCWMLPVILAFSLISGKQPHYLVPLLPAAILLVSLLMSSVSTGALRDTVMAVIMLALAGQSVASIVLLPAYDLRPVASYVQTHQDKDWAFVRNYHGEIGFLGRLEEPIDNLDDKNRLQTWFDRHPQGLAVIRYTDESEIAGFKKITSSAYRGRYIGIFSP